MKVKIIYGTDTGNTERIVGDLEIKLKASSIDYETVPVTGIPKEHWGSHKNYILGIPTWYDGELQSCWEDYFDTFKTIDFTDKTVAIFGLGDQIGYDEWFCDGIGILAEVVESNGGKLVGFTENDDSYDFDESPKSLLDEDTFYGLCLDEDNQDELTEERLDNWIEKISKEFQDE